jgi:hypothetical protein
MDEVLEKERKDVRDKLLRLKRDKHNGQGKLLGTEIQHATEHIENREDEFYIIYAGAAPSHHLGMLMILYPNAKFILVDPNDFMIRVSDGKNDYVMHYEDLDNFIYMDFIKNNRSVISDKYTGKRMIKYQGKVIDKDITDPEENRDRSNDVDFIIHGKERVYIYESYMDIGLGDVLSGLSKTNLPILFWSDIRTSSSGSSYPTEFDIIDNSFLIWDILQHLTVNMPDDYPFYSMLKFRMPFEFSEEEYKSDRMKQLKKTIGRKHKIDIKESLSKGYFPYIDGSVYVQSWAPVHSTETRLWSNLSQIRNKKFKMYNIREYADRMSYYNHVERHYGKFKQKYENTSYNVDHCGDCALMTHILERFVEKYHGKDASKVRVPFYINAWAVFSKRISMLVHTHIENNTYETKYGHGGNYRGNRGRGGNRGKGGNRGRGGKGRRY